MSKTANTPSPDLIGPNTPLRLNIAAALAFPDGSMTASGLRRESARGRLVVERIAGKDYTTLAAIERMRELCRVPQKAPTLASARRAKLQWHAPQARGVGHPRRIAQDQHGLRCRGSRGRRARTRRTPRKQVPAQSTRGRHPSEILIADVLAIYLIDVAPSHAREDETKQRVLTLDAWWGDRTLADVNGANCRAYAEFRTSQPWKSAKPTQTAGAAKGVGGGAGANSKICGRRSITTGVRATVPRSSRSCCRRGPLHANGGLRGQRQRAFYGPHGEPSRSCVTRTRAGQWAATSPVSYWLASTPARDLRPSAGRPWCRL